MALQSSASSANPLTLNEIKTEFTGGGNNLRSYLRAGGQVASHWNNSTIPTSGTIKILDFLSTSRNFEATLTTGTNGFDVGYDSGAWGSMSQTTIGVSKSATTQSTVTGIWENYNAYFDFFLGVLVETYNLRFRISGNNTGTWWDKIFLDNVELAARSAASTPAGTYSVSTFWDWSATFQDGSLQSGQTWNRGGLSSLGSGVSVAMKVTMT